jgi:hypothetical protein
MNEQANIDLVKQCYDAYQQGDIQRLLGCLADDIDWDLPVIEAVPISGKRKGRDKVAEFFQTLAQTQEPRQFQPQEFIAQGDRVVVTGHYEWTVKATGIDYGCDWTHIFTVANGKIAKFKEYTDTHQAALAYQPQQAAIGAAARPGAAPPPVH